MQHEETNSAVSDAALLRRFVRGGRQAAFSQLVSRYSRLVYSTCLRDVQNPTLAEDAHLTHSPASTSIQQSGDPVARYVGEQIWRGGRYQVVELKREALVRHTILAFFGSDHLLHRVLVTTFFDDGTVTTDEAFLSHIKTDAPAAVRLFVMVPPKNATLMDTAKLQVKYDALRKRSRAGR